MHLLLSLHSAFDIRHRIGHCHPFVEQALFVLPMGYWKVQSDFASACHLTSFWHSGKWMCRLTDCFGISCMDVMFQPASMPNVFVIAGKDISITQEQVTKLLSLW